MTENNDIALSVKNVSKTFKLPHERHSGLKQSIVSKLGGKHQRGYEIQKVLKDISFDVHKGEFFGIVGRNGSGKSTLLKLISGIYSPDKGSIKVEGSLTPFIELGVGFNHELSGRENVFLNGALMGFSRKEMEAKYDDIVEFAELSEFMDQKLKNYSSGMQVRLAFSIAIQSHSDVLILDEVLAVGDEAFQRKCNAFFEEIKRDKTKTIVLVTHSMDAVQQYCHRAMLIEEGEIVAIGDPVDVAEQYSGLFITTKTVNKDGTVDEKIAQNDRFDIKNKLVKDRKKINMSFSIKPLDDFAEPVVGVYMARSNGDIVWRWSSDDETPTNSGLTVNLVKNKVSKIEIELDNILPSDSFAVTLLIRKQDRSEEYAKYSRLIRFDNYSSSLYQKFWQIKEVVRASNDE